jgi:O-antigen/teichoic acid export membrane protein
MSWLAGLRARLRADGGSRFRRNVLLVFRANIVAQALPLLAAPWLTRLYTPADFGALALFASALSMGLAFVTLRLDWSIPNPRSRQAAAGLLLLGVLALLALTLLAAGLAWALQPWWPEAALALGPLWLLLPLALLGGGLQQLLQAWQVRGADLAALGRSKVVSSVANVGVSLAASPWLGPAFGAWGLVAGALAGAWAALLLLWKRSEHLALASRRLGGRRLRAVARRYRAEVSWSTVVSLANAASLAAPPLLLARHFSVAEVGWYALMHRVALAPLGLVTAAVSQSFWAEAARLVRDDRAALARLYKRGTVRMVWVAVPLALACLAGPWWVGAVFGAERWSGAGWVLAASVPMIVAQALVSPLSHLVVHGRQHWQAAWDVARLVALVVAVEWAATAGIGVAPTILLLSMLMAVMYAVLFALNLLALR